MIDPRPAVIGRIAENLAGDWVEAGSAAFRVRFMVQCVRAESAREQVTSGVQEIAMQRKDSRLKWSGISIAGRRVLVTVTYRLKGGEWDDLIDLTKQLRRALA